MTLRQQWNDKRLRFKEKLPGLGVQEGGTVCPGTQMLKMLNLLLNNLSVSLSFWKLSCVAGKIKYLTMTDASKVWMPDTFFRNEKIGRFHTILTPNLYVRVFPNGDVAFNAILSSADLSTIISAILKWPCPQARWNGVIPLSLSSFLLEFEPYFFKIMCLGWGGCILIFGAGD